MTPRSFKFLAKLGQGAFGEVHLAELTTEDAFSQTVAVKWLHAQFSGDPELASRLRDEARLLGLLRHPNIVQVSGLTQIDGRLAVLMEPVDGRDLTGAHLSPSAAAEVVARTADALDAAWETVPAGRDAPLRVVHRDIKPSNIMVTRHGGVKVMDFGVARATFETREAQTRSQQYGTARYMAPERWLDGIAEAPSDVFSLGVTLIELVSGEAVPRARLSREGFETDLAECVDRLNAHPALHSLAERMVSFDPTKRPDARTVYEEASKLKLAGDSLSDWVRAQKVAPPQPDGLTGTVVVEDTNAGTFAVTADTSNATISTQFFDTHPIAQAPAAAVQSATNRPMQLFAVSVGAVTLGLAGWLLWPSGSALNRDRPSPLEVSVESSTSPAPQSPPPVAAQPAVAPPQPVAAEPNPLPASKPKPKPVAPKPKADPKPVVAPVEPIAPKPEISTPKPVIPVIFNVAAGLTATVAGKTLRTRGTVPLKQGQVLRVKVDGGVKPFGCTIVVGNATEVWDITETECKKKG